MEKCKKRPRFIKKSVKNEPISSGKMNGKVQTITFNILKDTKPVKNKYKTGSFREQSLDFSIHIKYNSIASFAY